MECLFYSSTSFITPVYVVFLLHKGLNYKGVALVDGFFMVSTALLDYPTGGLADKYGRGPTTALACFFFGLGLFSYSLSTNLFHFLISEFLAAIGSALYSGSFLAWLVDSLKSEGRGEGLAAVLGWSRVLSLTVSMVGGVVGGVMAEHKLELPFLVGACWAFAAGILTLVLTKGRGELKGRKERKYLDFLKEGLKVLFAQKALMMITFGSFFVALGIPNFTLTWAPYMESLGAGRWLLGAASSFLIGGMGLGSYLGGRLPKRLGYKATILLSTASMALSFSSLTLVNDPLAFLFLSLPFEIGFGAMTPALNAWLNEYIPSEERATVISLRRTLTLPFSALGIGLMGALSDLASPRLAYVAGLGALTMAFLVYMKVPKGANDDD